MRSYNYLANQQPRELIELYSDIEQELLKIYVRELQKGTEPTKVFSLMQQKMQEYDEQTQKVFAVILADRKKRAVADGVSDFKEEETETKAVDNGLANALIAPMLVAGIGILATLNKKIVGNTINRYSNDLAYARQGTTQMNTILRKLANTGLTIYESFGGGKSKNYSIENVIRRDVMYQVNKANAEVNMENFNKSSAKFIEVSSHPTARTWNKYMKQPYEDHSSWQGKCYYSRDGEKVEGYEEFESTCGYGELLGIGGINCYHQFEMNYTGEPIATQYAEKEVQKQYALSQEQRDYERAIRKLKSARAVYETAGDDEMAKAIGQNIKMATSKLRTFCEINGLKYYNWRTQV